ncbi:HEAT repeat domain-containing protein [Tessaracoccus sp. OS52]|uniref:HEAT repeat domain-containing protein n=1 Tax=Tessaracoccus sp. OS52 TaxID=2886691 RepID=UPI001D123B20|nr:HEAT repeat domain-containing protein [Tessaracoccus sp. OS52]MCC2593594.1 HEAT repeat domain-containing protein [Tessaracoccus sp. OS52]
MDDEVWLRVGEVARRTGLSVRTLHHWDERGLLVPSGRSASDYRLYSADDLRRLLRIQHLKSLGLSLDEVAAALDSGEFDAAEALERHIETVQERIAAEQELLRRLTRLRAAATTGWEEVLEVVALTERLRHPDADVRFRAALEAPSGTSVAELVERLATDPEPGVREALTWALAHHGTAAIDPVVEKLDDPDPGVRHQFAHVLGKLRDPSVLDDLAPLVRDADADVAAKAAQAVGAIGGERAADLLVVRLGEAPDPDPVILALGAVGSAAVPGLLGLLTDGDEPARRRAAEALGFIGDERAATGLVAALGDASAGVRYEALVALGQTPGRAAAAAVESAQGSDDSRLRAVAQRLTRDRRAGSARRR